MSIYPTVRPSLTLDFQKSKQLDPRITFSRTQATGKASYVQGGVIKYADEHQARFEDKGLLVEESRINNFKYSEDFSQAASYSLINNGDGQPPVLDATLYEAPDGSLTAQRWTLQITDTTNAGNQSGIQASASGIPASAYVTVWAKSATGADQTVFLTSQANDTFTVTSEWKRFDLGQRSTIPFRVFARGTYTAATVDVLVWGAQAETGDFSTSYIPTTGTSLTRAQELVEITGDNFSSWWNSSEGSIVTVADNFPSSGSRKAWEFNDGTHVASGPTLIKSVTYFQSPVAGNYTNSTINFGSIKTKTAFTFTTNAFIAGSGDGSDTLTNTSGLDPNVVKVVIGKGRGGYSEVLNGTIARIHYYPTQVSNEQLEVLTS